MHQIQPLFEKLQNIPGLCRIRIDLNGKIMFLNNAFRNKYRHINYPYEGTDILQFVTKEERLKCVAIASRCIKSPSTIIRTKLHHFDAGGKKVWTQWEFMLISDSFESKMSIEGLGMDITDYMAEDAMVQHIPDRLNDLIFIVDANYVIHSVNEKASKKVESLLGKKISPGGCFRNLFSGNFTDRQQMLFDRALSGETVSTETVILGGNKEYLLHIIFMPVIEKKRSIGKVIVSVINITEQGVLENNSSDELNIIRCGITEVVKAKDNERIRIAAELHDNVNQLLGTALLYLSLLNNDKDHLPELLPKTIDLIGKSINEIRSLSHSEAAEPEDCSVFDEIKEIAEAIMTTSDITVTCKFDNTITCNLTDFEKLNVLRIVQEATNNIIKHANASKIAIDIRKADKKLELRITDDGRGFHPAAIKKGAGLVNIRYRAKLLKARHILQSKPGQGTCLYIAMPYAEGNHTGNDLSFMH